MLYRLDHVVFSSQFFHDLSYYDISLKNYNNDAYKKLVPGGKSIGLAQAACFNKALFALRFGKIKAQ